MQEMRFSEKRQSEMKVIFNKQHMIHDCSTPKLVNAQKTLSCDDNSTFNQVFELQHQRSQPI